MSIKKHIPNTITLGNLFCGCLALISAFEGDLVWTAYFVGISLVLDFFDGFTARMLKVTSAIGKDLDSLADMVTFGAVPGMVMLQLINTAIFNTYFITDPAAAEGWTIYPPLSALPEITQMKANSPLFYLSYLALVIPIFSCIRLAKFNNDTRQSDSFIGLPTPANTMVICSIPLIMHFQADLTFVNGLFSNVWFLCILSFIMSLLLVVEIPLFALKFKNFSWTSNKLVYVFLIASVILLVSLHFLAIPLVILLYILLSIVNNIFLKTKV